MALKITRYSVDEPGDALLTLGWKRLSRRRTPGFPRTVQVETIAACNAACVFCPYGRLHPAPPAGKMPIERYERLLEECARNGVQRFSPYLTNEPLLDARIPDLVRIASRAMPRAKIVLTTNGAPLNSAMIDRLVDPGTGLHALYISFQGMAKQAYERTMGETLRFEAVLANVNALLEAMRKRRLSRPKIWVTMVASRLVDAPRAVAYWKSRGVRAKYTALENRAGWAPQAEGMSVGKMGYYEDCPRMFKQAYICHDGVMLLCCTDYGRKQPLGNAFEEGIAAIWNGGRMAEMRRRYLDGRIHTIPLCGSCRVDREAEVEA